MRSSIFLALVPLFATGAVCGGGGDDFGSGPSQCSQDAFACENGEPLEPEAECTADRELAVEIGDGDGKFTALAAGESPTVVYGPQGGQHALLGVRVQDPDLDHPSMELALEVLGCDDDPCEAEDEVLGARTITLGGTLGFPIVGGALEQPDLTLPYDVFGEYALINFRVVVTDPCGRTGQALHTSAP